MTIYPAAPPEFSCGICQRPQKPTGWRWAGEYPIPPVCRRCEIDYGVGIGGFGDRNRDRRIIRQISALAAALTAEAHKLNQNKEPRYG